MTTPTETVTDTFTSLCPTCGDTVHTVNGKPQPHEHAPSTFPAKNAAEFITEHLRSMQRAYTGSMKHDTSSPEFAHCVTGMVDGFQIVILAELLRLVDPGLADRAAVEIDRYLEAGDTLGELLYEWQMSRNAGKPISETHDGTPGYVNLFKSLTERSATELAGYVIVSAATRELDWDCALHDTPAAATRELDEAHQGMYEDDPHRPVGPEDLHYRIGEVRWRTDLDAKVATELRVAKEPRVDMGGGMTVPISEVLES